MRMGELLVYIQRNPVPSLECMYSSYQPLWIVSVLKGKQKWYICAYWTKEMNMSYDIPSCARKNCP